MSHVARLLEGVYALIPAILMIGGVLTHQTEVVLFGGFILLFVALDDIRKELRRHRP